MIDNLIEKPLTTYTLTKNDSVIRDADGASIPPDEANTDYRAYLAWVAEGNMPNPYVPPAPPTPLTAADKLETAGLTVDELKELLGL
jgi:hypothetical protein